MSRQSTKAARRPQKSSRRTAKKATKTARASEKKLKSSRARATARSSRATARSTAKPASKSVAKTAASSVKPAVKHAAKAAEKPVEKAAPKAVSKQVSKIAANIAAKIAAKEAIKAKHTVKVELSESAMTALTMFRTFSPPVQPMQQAEPAPVRGAHKYQVGDAVYFTSPSFGRAAASGAYTVIKVLPSDGEDRQYRIKSSVEAFERVAKESQLERI